MASERESGWLAFQQGDTQGAIALLEAACGQNPGDYEAHLYLGAAYGKAGRNNDAVTSITKAVQLQPSNPQARYNLGVALENAGFAVQAMEAVQQAVILDPNYVKAQEALQRLQKQAKLQGLQLDAIPSPSAKTTTFSQTPVVSRAEPELSAAPAPQPTTQMPAWQSAASEQQEHFLTPDDVQQPEAPLAQDGGAPLASAPGYEPPAALQKTTALPSYGLLSDYSPSPNSPAGPTSVPDAYPTVLPPPNYQDELDFVQAFKDYWQILIAPVRFFTSQAGRIGFMSPICMLGVYLVFNLVQGVISSGAQGLVGLAGTLIVLPFKLVVILCSMMISYLLLALMAHFLGMMFGNRTDYSVSFRAVVYANAPNILIGLIVSALMAFFVVPGFRDDAGMTREMEKIFNQGPAQSVPVTISPGGSSPVTAKPGSAKRSPTKPATSSTTPTGPPTQEQMMKVVSLVLSRNGGTLPMIVIAIAGWVWSTVLMIIAVHKMQNISLSGACTVWFIMFLVGASLAGLILYAFYSVFTAIIVPLLQSGAAGGVPGH